MTRNLLIASSLCLATSLCALAQNASYTTEELGDVNVISDNGRFAVITDEDNIRAYLWDSLNPDVFEDITPELGSSTKPSGLRLKGATAYDVSNYGMVVGGLHYADGKSYPAYYVDGKWNRLEMPADARNNNECIAVTPDGSIIAGYSNKWYEPGDGNVGNGQYYPVQWKLNADGEYELISYHDLDYSDHQGFYPLCMNPEGTVIGGKLYCGVASEIPALIVDGELKIFDTIEFKLEPFIYQGKYYCGTNADGKQIWTDDPNDPNIVLYREVYIDGYHDMDMEGAFIGLFSSCDNNGNFYGSRTRVSDVSEDGSTGDFNKGAAIYNINDDKWIYNNRSSYYTCGVGTDLIFASDNIAYVDGEKCDITEEFDIDCIPDGSTSTGISKCSADGLVLGGIRQEFMEAIGDFLYFPYIVVRPGAFSGTAPACGVIAPSILLSRNTIAVKDGEATLYDLNGRIMGHGNYFTVAPGAYIVKTAERSTKVLVR